MLKFLCTLWLSKVVARTVSLIDRSRGSNYSGMIATRLMPDFVGHFHGIDYDRVIFITGTNGKSTTTNLVTHTLRSAGKKIACNEEGANMMGGVATTLIKNSSLTGRFNKELLVLEIDERSLPGIRKVLPGRHMGITNLQKDQVQRNGDPDFIYRKFQKAIGPDMTLYLNSEEPRSSGLSDCAGAARYFSIAPNERSFKRPTVCPVTLPCPKCGYPIVYDRYNLASIGRFHCSHCDHRSKEKPDVLVTDVDFEHHTFRCSGRTWTVPTTDPFNLYNYALDIAVCRNFGLSDDEIEHGIETFESPVVHYTVSRLGGKEIYYLQAKQENPEALQSQLDIIAGDPRPKILMVGLNKVADFPPHYAGTFYFFDCDLRHVVDSHITDYIAFSANVSYDIANRLSYAGAPEAHIQVLDTDDIPTIFHALDAYDTEVVYVLTNIKSFVPIQQFLAGGGQNA